MSDLILFPFQFVTNLDYFRLFSFPLTNTTEKMHKCLLLNSTNCTGIYFHQKYHYLKISTELILHEMCNIHKKKQIKIFFL